MVSGIFSVGEAPADDLASRWQPLLTYIAVSYLCVVLQCLLRATTACSTKLLYTRGYVLYMITILIRGWDTRRLYQCPASPVAW